jgi:succinate-acetate transporter protein
MAARATHPHDTGGNGSADREELAAWTRQTRVFLQPIAPPSILGLFGFAAATFMVAAHEAGWYGGPRSGLYLFPFAAAFGGVAQLLAGMWAYRARDGVATAMHGAWGSFWIGYGVLNLLAAFGVLTIPPGGAFPEFGFWFFVLAAVTVAGAVAALGDNLALFAVLASLAVGAAFLGIFYYDGGSGWQEAGGWVLIGSSILAFYTATAMMLEAAWGRVVLPLGEPRVQANVPGRKVTRPIEYHDGEPGVRHGQ